MAGRATDARQRRPGLLICYPPAYPGLNQSFKKTGPILWDHWWVCKDLNLGPAD